jgi:hypothetical protein
MLSLVYREKLFNNIVHNYSNSQVVFLHISRCDIIAMTTLNAAKYGNKLDM